MRPMDLGPPSISLFSWPAEVGRARRRQVGDTGATADEAYLVFGLSRITNCEWLWP
jgi:hypothetical protein